LVGIAGNDRYSWKSLNISGFSNRILKSEILQNDIWLKKGFRARELKVGSIAALV